jgi:hypothetical protein
MNGGGSRSLVQSLPSYESRTRGSETIRGESQASAGFTTGETRWAELPDGSILGTPGWSAPIPANSIAKGVQKQTGNLGLPTLEAESHPECSETASFATVTR